MERAAEAAWEAVAVEYMHFEESLHVDGTRDVCCLAFKYYSLRPTDLAREKREYSTLSLT